MFRFCGGRVGCCAAATTVGALLPGQLPLARSVRVGGMARPVWLEFTGEGIWFRVGVRSPGPEYKGGRVFTGSLRPLYVISGSG